MSRTITATVAVLIVLVLILFNTTFTVNFHELAVTTRLGRPAGIVRDPGLHLKLPFFIDTVAKLDTRSQLVRSPMVTGQTADDQQVLVQPRAHDPVDALDGNQHVRHLGRRVRRRDAG